MFSLSSQLAFFKEALSSSTMWCAVFKEVLLSSSTWCAVFKESTDDKDLREKTLELSEVA